MRVYLEGTGNGDAVTAFAQLSKAANDRKLPVRVEDPLALSNGSGRFFVEIRHADTQEDAVAIVRAHARPSARWRRSVQASFCAEIGAPVTAQKNTLPETLIERVEKLVQANKEPILSTTPVSVAVGELAARTEALEKAVREIALEVQKLSTQG